MRQKRFGNRIVRGKATIQLSFIQDLTGPTTAKKPTGHRRMTDAASMPLPVKKLFFDLSRIFGCARPDRGLGEVIVIV